MSTNVVAIIWTLALPTLQLQSHAGNHAPKRSLVTTADNLAMLSNYARNASKKPLGTPHETLIQLPMNRKDVDIKKLRREGEELARKVKQRREGGKKG
ncbi:hypothetical protein BGX38DRAFT_781343 [Terfezia claveryi]|nr:hypothetical protein BGX38DRAFT_781343 [Terfezia claveryi]